MITPTLERVVYMAGYASNKSAQRVHDDLWARVLALRTAETNIVLAAVDLIGLNRLHCQAIENAVQAQTGLPIKLLISCSHTHFGPDTIGLWGATQTESGVDPHYMDFLKATIITAAIDAVQNATQPVHCRSAAIEVTGVAKNYRDPQITDEEATCLQFLTPDEQPFATLVIYPCHPEGVHPDSRDISCDYVYALRQHIEATIGGAALFMPGALGGMMSPDLPEPTHAEAAKMGNTIAEASIRALANQPRQPIETVNYHRAEFAIPMQNMLFQMATNLGLLPNLMDTEGNITSETGLIQIGDTWLATVPGELLPRLGLQIKAELKQAGAKIAGVVGLANDELGYILPEDDFIFPEDWLNPGKQYEESMSIGPATAPRLLAALQRLLSANSDDSRHKK